MDFDDDDSLSPPPTTQKKQQPATKDEDDNDAEEDEDDNNNNNNNNNDDDNDDLEDGELDQELMAELSLVDEKPKAPLKRPDFLSATTGEDEEGELIPTAAATKAKKKAAARKKKAAAGPRAKRGSVTGKKRGMPTAAIAPAEEEANVPDPEPALDIEALLASYRSASDAPTGLEEVGGPSGPRVFVVKSLTPLSGSLEPDIVTVRKNLEKLIETTSRLLGRTDVLNTAKSMRVVQDLAVLQARTLDQFSRLVSLYENTHRDMLSVMMDPEHRTMANSKQTFEAMGAAAFSTIYCRPGSNATV